MIIWRKKDQMQIAALPLEPERMGIWIVSRDWPNRMRVAAGYILSLSLQASETTSAVLPP